MLCEGGGEGRRLVMEVLVRKVPDDQQVTFLVLPIVASGIVVILTPRAQFDVFKYSIICLS